MRGDDPRTRHGVRQQVADLHRRIRGHANASNWDRVSVLTRRRDALLAAAPPAIQGALLEASLRCNQAVLERARAARSMAAQQLTTLKRGRDGARRYAEQQQATD